MVQLISPEVQLEWRARRIKDPIATAAVFTFMNRLDVRSGAIGDPVDLQLSGLDPCQSRAVRSNSKGSIPALVEDASVPVGQVGNGVAGEFSVPVLDQSRAAALGGEKQTAIGAGWIW